MDLDFDKYLQEYPLVSIQDIQKIIDLLPEPDVDLLEFDVEMLHDEREKEMRCGRADLRPGPLIQLLSVSLQPNAAKSLGIYGRINITSRHSDYGPKMVLISHDFYSCDPSNIEVFGMGSTLSLIHPNPGPNDSFGHRHNYLPLDHKINLDLFDEYGHVFANQSFVLENSEDDYEEVKSHVIYGDQGSLTLRYIAIPLGVFCNVDVVFCGRHGMQVPNSINVNGKIAVRYAHTYGNYSSEECTLFEKHSEEFERVEMNQKLHLSRHSCSLPAYSSLIVHMELSEFETGKKIVKGSVNLRPQQAFMSGDALVLDDMIVQVYVTWFSPTPMGTSDYEEHDEVLPIQQGTEEEMEDMDIYVKDESFVESSDDKSTLSLDIPWVVRPHLSKPSPSPGVEIFSVVVNLENLEATQIHGSIIYLNNSHEVYLFKRGEEDPLRISNHVNSIPIVDGSRGYEDDYSMRMELDIKDVEGSFGVKGYLDWRAEQVESWCSDKQLCSVIQGEHGFAAVHYSIFSRAVEAYIQVSLERKKASGAGLKVHGSLIAEYGSFKYASRYDKDYYRMMIFSRTEEDSIALEGGDDRRIVPLPLSRSSLVVPSYSSLIINVDLFRGDLASTEIAIGETRKNIEGKYCNIYIDIEWFEIK